MDVTGNEDGPAQSTKPDTTLNSQSVDEIVILIPFFDL